MNESDLKVSIIVPVYNVGKYVAHCLQTIIKQTYTNIEVIAVNDASTDNSLDVIRKIRDERIILIDLKENVGVDKARFKGIERSSGAYLMFVDSDDFLPKTAVERLVNAEISTNADIIEGNIIRTLDGFGWISKRGNRKPLILDQPQLFDDYYITFFGINLLSVSMCGKLYRRSLFENIEYSAYRFNMGEDLLVNMKIFPKVKRYVRLNDDVYYYRYGGLTSKYNPYLWTDLKRMYFIKKQMIEKYSYWKASGSIKYEMCNVLRSTIQQMIRFKISRFEIDRFLECEIQLGFIDEITCGVRQDVPFYKCLSEKNKPVIIALCQHDVRKQLPGRLLKKMVTFVIR